MARLPETYLNNMKSLLSEEGFLSYLKCFDAPRVAGLRVNTSKISPEDFVKIAPFELRPVPWTTDGFYIDASEKASKHPYYFAGLYYLQEPSAMLPAALLPIAAGDRVLDTCAAPGGKSTELAAKLSHTGVLFSNDISNSRAQALLKNLELFGIPNAVILSEDLKKLEDRYFESFDKILIDAPCSGEGMFRKEPAVIKSWEEHGNQFYRNLQEMITASALKMLKPGGMMVYSTCTFSMLEDEEMILYMKSICPGLHVVKPPVFVDGFLHGFVEKASVKDPELANCIRLFPHKIQGEGHFAALLQKDGEGDISFSDGACNHLEEGLGKDAQGAANRPESARLPEEAQAFLKSLKNLPENGTLSLRNDRLSLVPAPQNDLRGLRILREGLLLGECKKGRFEPSQALAMALRKEDYDNVLDLSVSDPRVLKYLKGETLDVTDIAPEKEGWVLVCVDSFPLGFAKGKNGILKNKYLPGWRYQ